MTQLSNQTSDPNFAVAFRKSVNEQIQNLLRDCMLTLHNNCDRVAKQFADSNPAYFANYKAARKLKPTTMSTQLRLYVTNALGLPVQEGEVYIIGTDRSAALDLTGYALVDHIPFGIHQFTLTTQSSTNTYGPYDFKKGKSLTFHVQIVGSSSAPKVTVTEEDLTETISK